MSSGSETKSEPVHQIENLNVLVVDDDETFRKVISELLLKLKSRVTAVDGGQEALRLLKEQASRVSPSKDDFDIILLDYNMPHMNGFEMLKFFKKAYTLVMSGDNNPDIISQAFDHGVEDFLQKPIRPEMLKTRIQMCMEDRYRRLKEKELESLLKAQREKNSEHQKIIETFKTEISEKIETPIQAVMKTIGELMNNDENSSTAQYKGTLISILKSLGSHDLYKPAFEEIESSTKKWLEQEYTPMEQAVSTPGRVTSKSNHSGEKVSTFEFKDLNNWSFNVFDYRESDLIKALHLMSKDLGFLEEYKIDAKKWQNFILEIKNHYNGNDYHNFYHAIDVTQFIYACLKIEKISSYFSPLEKFALFVAAICHDLDHPGLNNNYQVNAATPLAILYNDQSVLENHHCALTFKLLKNKNNDILENLSVEDWNAFRKIFLTVVLGTDMTHHFEIQTKFQTRLKTGPMTNDAKDRQQFAQILLKLADISNVARPFEVSQKMAENIVNEFMNQGDIEKAKQLPISPLMDRSTMNKPKLQVNFIDYIASPLFKVVTSWITELETLNEIIAQNRNNWAEKMEKETKEEKKESKPVLSTAWVHGELDSNLLAKIRGFTVLLCADDVVGKSQLLNSIQTRGYDLKTAVSETQALDALQKDLDVIILQMDMKSCDSFHLLDMLTQKASRKIPIIGIVAGKDDKRIEKCKNMSILTRPVEISHLIRIVDQGVSDSQDSAPCVNVEIGLEQSGDDVDFLKELIEIFVPDVQKQIKEMREHLKDGKILDLEHVAHSLKGAAGQIAAKPLSRAAFLLEESCKKKSGDYEKLIDLLDLRYQDFAKNALGLVQNHK